VHKVVPILLLGPIFFSIFINDLPNACVFSRPFVFADDGALHFDNISRGNYGNIKQELKLVNKWLKANKLSLNNEKTKLMILDSKPDLDAILVEIREDLTLVISGIKQLFRNKTIIYLNHLKR
jgi:hypothetical protein